MQYLRRMVLVFTCVMLMGGITACGNGDNAANPDTNTGGTNQNGTVNDVTNDIGDGVEDAVDDVEDGVRNREKARLCGKVLPFLQTKGSKMSVGVIQYDGM